MFHLIVYSVAYQNFYFWSSVHSSPNIPDLFWVVCISTMPHTALVRNITPWNLCQYSHEALFLHQLDWIKAADCHWLAFVMVTLCHMRGVEGDSVSGDLQGWTFKFLFLLNVHISTQKLDGNVWIIQCVTWLFALWHIWISVVLFCKCFGSCIHQSLKIPDLFWVVCISAVPHFSLCATSLWNLCQNSHEARFLHQLDWIKATYCHLLAFVMVTWCHVRGV